MLGGSVFTFIIYKSCTSNMCDYRYTRFASWNASNWWMQTAAWVTGGFWVSWTPLLKCCIMVLGNKLPQQVQMHIKRWDDPFGLVWLRDSASQYCSTPIRTSPCMSSGAAVSNRRIRPTHKLVLWLGLSNSVPLFIKESCKERREHR